MKFVIVSLLLISTLSFAGTDSGGGGGVFSLSNQTVLLDMLLVDKNFQDSEEFKYLGVSYSTDKASNVRNSSARKLALAHFAYWATNGFMGGNYSGMASAALRNGVVKWSFVEDTIDLPSNYYLPINLLDKKPYLKLAAYYRRDSISISKSLHTVVINKTLWNSMAIRSQAGLLIHEAVRQLQMGSSLNGRLYFSERALQQATAIISSCEYNSKLDKALAKIMDGRNEYSYDDVNFQNLIQNHCEISISE